ncbi:SsrA-binding protein SmpB [Candidatus Gracilibacteria bacterium]|nr:SsrA-binding protein SmpB [Candidatus Gracilibacteria bacterium]
MSEIVKNKKAYFDYEILESQEAGIELLGHEMKSVRAKHVNLKGSYISAQNGELWLKQMHIGVWKSLSNRDSVEVERPRKIFLPKKKIIYYGSKLKEGGYTLLALELYLKGSLVKVRVGLAKGKKSYQKKQTLKERTIDREASKMLKRNY